MRGWVSHMPICLRWLCYWSQAPEPLMMLNFLWTCWDQEMPSQL